MISFRRPVADRDRRCVALGLDLEPGLDQLQYRRAGRARRDDQCFEQVPVVVRPNQRQRGAIRIPPSSRMLSAFR